LAIIVTQLTIEYCILYEHTKWVRKLLNKKPMMLLVTFNIYLLSQDIVCIEIYKAINNKLC